MVSSKNIDNANIGTYTFCLDNTHSKYTSKKVYFVIEVRDNTLKKDELIENSQRLKYIDETLEATTKLLNNYRVREARSRRSITFYSSLYYLFICLLSII